MKTFRDKIAIITGAASGIGLGLASELSKRGAVVIVVDIDEERLDKASRDCIIGIHEKRVVDVIDFDSVKSLFAEIHEKYGRIDFLFNNAGIGGTLPFEDATLAHWNRIINLNVYGVINGVTAIYPLMKQQEFGHIINTSSISGLIPFPGQTLYNTTKFAITGLSLTLEKELRKNNINISIVCPGMVRTRIFINPLLEMKLQRSISKYPKRQYVSKMLLATLSMELPGTRKLS